MSHVTSNLIKSCMNTRLMQSRICSVYYPTPPYLSGKTIIATYSGPMANIGAAIENMNAAVPTIMALMPFNTVLGIFTGYQFNYDFGGGTSVVIPSNPTFPGGYTYWGETVLSYCYVPTGLFFTSEALALALAESSEKTLVWTWIYTPQFAPGTAKPLFFDDAISDWTGGGAPFGAHYDNYLLSVKPDPDVGVPLTEGSVFKLPSPYYRGIIAFPSYIGYFGTAAGSITSLNPAATDYTGSGGAGGTGSGGLGGAGGNASGGAGGGGNQGPL